MQRILRWINRCHFPLLMQLSAFPCALIAMCVAFPDAYACAPALLLAGMVCSALCAAVPAARRLPAAALFSALIVFLGARLLPLGGRPVLILLPAAACALLFASLPFISRGIHSISPVFFALGVASHVFANFFFRISADNALIRGSLTAAFIAFLPLFLLAMNRITLDNASLARFRLPASMRRTNILLTLAFLALALLLAAAPAAARVLFFLWKCLRSAIRAVGAIITAFLPDAPDMGGGGMGMGMIPGLGDMTAQESSRLAVILERIASYFAAIIIIAGSAILLLMLIRLLRRLLRAAIARIRSYVSIVSDDYEDEITDTRGEDGWREHVARSPIRLRRRQSAPDEPGPLIRYRYARLLHKHAAWSDSSTARENLPAEAAGIYERARYSNHPVTQADADAFAQETRRV